MAISEQPVSSRPDPDPVAPLDVPPRPVLTPRGAFWLGVAILVATTLFSIQTLELKALARDLGIQFHLSGETLRGALPLVDFEHGWNALGWYVGAALYALSLGNPTVFGWLWGRVTGTFLTSLAVLVAARRLRWETPWLLGLVATWLLVSYVPHGKYAIPALWLLAALPVGRLADGRAAIVTRLVLGAVTLLLHVDLTIMLGLGLFFYDLIGARALDLRVRVQRAAAPAIGAAVALAGEVGVYALLGHPPGELLALLLFDRTNTIEGMNFGYPLFFPIEGRVLLYPVGLLLPFVPFVWQRIPDGIRLAGLLQLGLSLIVIRKADSPHLAAASTLLAFVLVGTLRSLATTPAPAASHISWGRRLATAAVGAAAVGSALAVAFLFHSLAAWVLLALLVTGWVVYGGRIDTSWAAVGAGLALLGTVTVGIAGRTGLVAAETRGADRSALIAATIERDVAKCVPDGQAVIVPEPLPLYVALDLDNPTPFYLFYPGFADEQPRVEQLVEDGGIPAILQVRDWPLSFQSGLADVVEANYDVCSIRHVHETSDRIVIWRWQGLPPVD